MKFQWVNLEGEEHFADRGVDNLKEEDNIKIDLEVYRTKVSHGRFSGGLL